MSKFKSDRPRKPKTHVLQVRLTDEELESLDFHAKKLGLGRSAVVRQALKKL